MASKKAGNTPKISRDQVEAKRKGKRLRIGEDGRNILNVDLPEGYVGRWVNDTEDRIEHFQRRGYEVYKGKELSSYDGLVDSSDGVGSAMTKNVGKGTKAVFMVQRKDYYDEDFADKQKAIDEVERTILANDEDGRYGKVKLEN